MKYLESNDILYASKKWIKWFILIIAMLVYANTVNHQMVLDDYSIIVTHSHVQNGIDGIGEIMTTNYRNGNSGFNDGLYRPLSPMTFALEKEFFDSNTSIAHFINILLYGLGCFFLFLSLQQVFYDKPLIIPLTAALIFVCHPLHTEVVANIKGRDELLAFFGLSLSLWHLLKSLDSNSIKHKLLSILFYIIALFSKESAVTYAVIIPLLIYIKPELTFKKMVASILMLIPFAIAFMGLRYAVVNGMDNAVDAGNFGLLNNPIAASNDASLKWGSTFALQLTFLQKLIYPFNLIHDYSFNQIPLVKLNSIQSILGIFVFVGLCGLAIWGTIKKNIFGILAAIYLTTILVSSQILIAIGIQFAERMLFLSVLVLAILVPLALEKLIGKQASLLSLKNQKTIGIVSIAICLIYSIKTFDRNKAWENNLSLYQADIQTGIKSARVNYNLGSELNEQAQRIQNQKIKSEYLKQSIQCLERAISIYPEYKDAYNNLGLAYKNAGDNKSAIQTYLKGIKLDPGYSKNYFNLSTIYYADKQFRKAILAMQEYVKLKPNVSSAYFLMGQSAGSLNKFDEAIGYLNQSISIDSQNINALNFLGMAYGMAGNFNMAETSFQKALQINVNRTDILMNLALNYRNQGKTQQEKNTLNKILSLEPNNQAARSQLNSISSN